MPTSRHFLSLIAVSLSGLALTACTPPPVTPVASPVVISSPAPETQVQAPLDKKSNSFVMVGGKMMMVIDGRSTRMEKETKLASGEVVMVNGQIKTNDGKTVMLKEGDMILLDGTLKILSPSATPESSAATNTTKPGMSQY